MAVATASASSSATSSGSILTTPASSTCGGACRRPCPSTTRLTEAAPLKASLRRSEEHTSELQSLMRISYAVFCLKKKTQNYKQKQLYNNNIRRRLQNQTNTKKTQ